MTIEYRLRPVTRFVVTRFESKPDLDNASGIKTLGEYDNAHIAYEVGYALAKAEADRLQLEPGSMDLIYPNQIIEQPVRVQEGLARYDMQREIPAGWPG